MKPGDVVRVRVNGENVTVLKVEAENVIVRRAVSGQEGIRHEYADFEPCELETVHESIQREFNEAIYRHKLAMSQMDAVEAVEVSAKEGPVQ